MEVAAQCTQNNSPLPSNAIYGVTADPLSKSYWIATDKGPAQVDLQGRWNIPHEQKVMSTSVDADGNGNI